MADFETVAVRAIAANSTWPLRAAVLWPEKEAGPSCLIEGDEAPETLHMGAFVAEELCAIGTFMQQQHPELPSGVSYRLRAMGTLKSAQGKGLGSQLVETGLDILSERGCDVVWCDARHVALGFYARLGWDVVGPSYQVPLRGPHRLAWRRI